MLLKNKALWLLIVGLLIFGSQLPWGCHSTPFVQGQRLYNYHCANCHMEDGTGLVKINPPLAGADYLQANQAALPCLIRNGISDSIMVNGIWYHQPMIAFPQLKHAEVANIINYINHAWGNDYGEVSIDQVIEWSAECPGPGR